MDKVSVFKKVAGGVVILKNKIDDTKSTSENLDTWFDTKLAGFENSQKELTELVQ